ncbi:MAG: tRNA (adenosine(37)-N6)-dimethylallyltransferase MiaA [Paludibacteraceae bacterium]|nr:tRNA (adenosine(37)-N6)-dimethylallyltransferase MiaA [Paludibacteraceae bacterium]
MTQGTLHIILGPTGVGKSQYAIEMAKRLGCSIINADSRQIYREIPICTDAPTAEMLASVKHYFVGTHSIHDNYSAGHYEQDALRIIHDEINKYGNAILSGGSMMYIDAVTKGIDDIPDIDPQLRQNVLDEYKNKGLAYMQEQLLALDPEHYATCDLKNWRRVLHAIEVCRQTGTTFTSLRKGQNHKRDFNVSKVGIMRDRETLYKRIDDRVIGMIDRGLIKEAEAVLPYRHLNALNTVGLKEVFGHFDGLYDLPEAIRLIQRNTRHYARKQMTWFRHDNSIKWIYI